MNDKTKAEIEQLMRVLNYFEEKLKEAHREIHRDHENVEEPKPRSEQ